jgi:hypothetical protein
MTIGVDQAVTLAVGTVQAADTLSKIVKRYEKKKGNSELAALLVAVKQTAMARIDEADQALTQLERTLRDKHIDMSKPLSESIENIPFWRPFESYQLSQLKKRFDASTDSISSSIDDIAALARCNEDTDDIQNAALESLRAKRDFDQKMLNSKSIAESIDLLRQEITKQKISLIT